MSIRRENKIAIIDSREVNVSSQRTGAGNPESKGRTGHLSSTVMSNERGWGQDLGRARELRRPGGRKVRDAQVEDSVFRVKVKESSWAAANSGR